MKIKGNYVLATYTKSEIDRYNNNPFTEALPNVISAHDFFPVIIEKPSDGTLSQNGSADARKSSLNSLLSEFYAPFDQQYYLYCRFMDVLYEGYAVRAPQKLLTHLDTVKQWDEDTFLKSPQTAFLSQVVTRGFSIIGPSGSGKSTIISKVMNFFPLSIKHKKCFQVPIIKLDCPEKCSTKQLCLDFFLELDRKLGFTDYYKSYSRSRFTEYGLIQEMSIKAVVHWVGMIIIDEVQNLQKSTPQAKASLLNTLKRINNIVSVPIVFIGTPDAKIVLHGNYQQARRSQGIGAFHWNKIASQSDDWDRLMQELWELQVLKNKPVLTEAIKNQYFIYSQGIIDTLLVLHIAVQKWAIDAGIEEITPELVKKVGERETSSTSSLIKTRHEIGKDSDFYFTEDDLGTVNDAQSSSKGNEKDMILSSKPNSSGKATNATIQPQGTNTIARVMLDAIANGDSSPECIYNSLRNIGYIATNKELQL